MQTMQNFNYTVYVTATIEKIVFENEKESSLEILKAFCGEISVKPGKICFDPESGENHNPSPFMFTGAKQWKLNPDHYHRWIKGNELLINKTGTWTYFFPPKCGENLPNQSVVLCESNFHARVIHSEKGDNLGGVQCAELYLTEVKPQGKKTFHFQQKHEAGELKFQVYFKLETQTFHKKAKQLLSQNLNNTKS